MTEDISSKKRKQENLGITIGTSLSLLNFFVYAALILYFEITGLVPISFSQSENEQAVFTWMLLGSLILIGPILSTFVFSCIGAITEKKILQLVPFYLFYFFVFCLNWHCSQLSCDYKQHLKENTE